MSGIYRYRDRSTFYCHLFSGICISNLSDLYFCISVFLYFGTSVYLYFCISVSIYVFPAVNIVAVWQLYMCADTETGAPWEPSDVCETLRTFIFFSSHCSDQYFKSKQTSKKGSQKLFQAKCDHHSTLVNLKHFEILLFL